MGWSTHRTTEMPAVTQVVGRHRKRRTGRILAAILVGLLGASGASAVFIPNLLGLSQPLTAAPNTSPPTDQSGAPAVAAAPPLTTAASPTSSPTPTTSSTTTRTKEPPPGSPLPSFEQSVLKLVNEERAKQPDCRELRKDADLQKAARAHSMDMARYRYHSHTGRNGSDPGDRIKAAGYDVSGGWAENIARGYPTPAAVMAAWMKSDGHRKNILNCRLRAIGVGAVRATNGQLYWTQDFGGR